MSENEAPRRCYVEKRVAAETALANAMALVEAMPADTRLTDASIHIGHAMNHVADFIDGIPHQPHGLAMKVPDEEVIRLKVEVEGIVVTDPIPDMLILTFMLHVATALYNSRNAGERTNLLKRIEEAIDARSKS